MDKSQGDSWSRLLWGIPSRYLPVKMPLFKGLQVVVPRPYLSIVGGSSFSILIAVEHVVLRLLHGGRGEVELFGDRKRFFDLLSGPLGCSPVDNESLLDQRVDGAYRLSTGVFGSGDGSTSGRHTPLAGGAASF